MFVMNAEGVKEQMLHGQSLSRSDIIDGGLIKIFQLIFLSLLLSFPGPIDTSFAKRNCLPFARDRFILQKL